LAGKQNLEIQKKELYGGKPVAPPGPEKSCVRGPHRKVENRKTKPS